MDAKTAIEEYLRFLDARWARDDAEVSNLYKFGVYSGMAGVALQAGEDELSEAIDAKAYKLIRGE